MQDHWEHFAHGADIGLRGFGATQARAFEQAALALTGVIADPSSIQNHASVSITCKAQDSELLLVEWLNALIYQMAVRHMLFGRFEVILEGTQLKGIAWGEPISLPRHQPSVEVKGATYTALRVVQSDSGQWMAQTIVDV